MKKTQTTTATLSLLMMIIGYFAYIARDEYFSVIPMLFLAVPAYFALLKTNFHKGFLFIVVLSLYATSIEALSILTAFPSVSYTHLTLPTIYSV